MSTAQPITVRELAEKLKVCGQRIRQLMRECKVGRKIGRDWILTPSEARKVRSTHAKKRQYTKTA